MITDAKPYAWIVAGIVTNITNWDGNTDPETGGFDPPDGTQLILIPDGAMVYIGFGATEQTDGSWVFEQPSPPILTPAQILASNTETRNRLLAAANLVIPALQDAVDLGDESANPALLLAWKQFRISVNKADLTLLNPPWPVPPQSGYGAVEDPKESLS